MEHFDPRVDAYIDKCADFAKPILKHLRQVVHTAIPHINETIKWGCPFFELNGSVCQMVAFKQHCGFGFWNAKALSDPEGVLHKEDGTAGSFGKITSMDDLPADAILIAYIKEAAALQDKPKSPAKPKAKIADSDLSIPDDFLTLLNGNPKAAENFAKGSNSFKKEYLQWLADAKTTATREKRMQTAFEWIGEGKSRMWKYK
jgi:uncharacterized protein YdeI (YjbR/CyaY-like superfamily)